MSDIDSYLHKLDGPQKTELERIRREVQHMLPDATEQISYGMPAFKYKNKYLVGYAAFKDHLSIFPGAGPIEALKEELTGFQTSKGTVQFTLDKPLPKALLSKIILQRVRDIEKTAL